MLVKNGEPAAQILRTAMRSDPVLAHVIVAMQRDLVTAVSHLPCQVWMALDLSPEEEEGRARPRPIERIEHCRCRVGVWPVVERQRCVPARIDTFEPWVLLPATSAAGMPCVQALTRCSRQ